MKHNKIFSLILAGALALTLTACGGGDKPAETPDTPEPPQQSQPIETPDAPVTDEVPGARPGSMVAQPDNTETPNEPDEPIVDTTIDIGETITVESFGDITFGEPTFDKEYRPDPDWYILTITVPTTITISENRANGTTGIKGYQLYNAADNSRIGANFYEPFINEDGTVLAINYNELVANTSYNKPVTFILYEPTTATNINIEIIFEDGTTQTMSVTVPADMVS